MDPNTARELFEAGGIVVLLDVPIGTECGIDRASGTIGPKFRGFKMIPPGVHFVHYRYTV